MNAKLILIIALGLATFAGQRANGVHGVHCQAQARQDNAKTHDEPVDQFELDIVILGSAISDDERFLVAWGNTEKQLEENKSLKNHGGGPREVRIVELEDGQVVTRGTFPCTVESLTMIGDSVVVAFVDSGLRVDLINAEPKLEISEIQSALRDLYVFDRESLALREKVQLPHIPKEFHPLANGKLAVHCIEKGQSSFTMCSVHPDGLKILKNQRHKNKKQIDYVRRNENQFEYLGAIYDISENRVVSLAVEPQYEPILDPAKTVTVRPHPRNPGLRDYVSPFCKGRHIFNGSVYDKEKRLIFSTRPAKPEKARNQLAEYISPIQPVCFTLWTENNLETQQEICRLETFLLLDGTQVGEQVVMFEKPLLGTRATYLKPSPVVSLSNIIVTSGNEIYRYRIPKFNFAKDQSPLHIFWPDKAVLSANQPHRFQLKSAGGEGEINYTLTREIDGVEIDQETGVITVNTPKLWQEFIERSIKSGRPDLEVVRAIEADGQPRDLKVDRAITPTQVFEKIHGQPCGLDMEPTYLKLEVKATDSYGQFARLTFYVTVLGTVDSIESARKLMERESEVKDATALPKSNPRDENQIRRLMELEQRLIEIEKKVKGLPALVKKVIADENR